MNNVLVTGCAGFIGSRVTELLLDSGRRVVGVDNFSDDYDIALKKLRLQPLLNQPGFSFELLDIEDSSRLNQLFRMHSIDGVIHLAARAGVRASLKRPSAYMRTNVAGCLNVLECLRDHRVQKLVLASSSTLYAGHEIPFSEEMEFRANWSNLRRSRHSG